MIKNSTYTRFLVYFFLCFFTIYCNQHHFTVKKHSIQIRSDQVVTSYLPTILVNGLKYILYLCIIGMSQSKHLNT